MNYLDDYTKQTIVQFRDDVKTDLIEIVSVTESFTAGDAFEEATSITSGSTIVSGNVSLQRNLYKGLEAGITHEEIFQFCISSGHRGLLERDDIHLRYDSQDFYPINVQILYDTEEILLLCKKVR